MKRAEAMRLFHEQGYSVEYQEFISTDITGNFDVEIAQHNEDITQESTEVHYYICEPGSAEKYYDLEFTDKEHVLTFIHYIMKNNLSMHAIGIDESLARTYIKKCWCV